MVLAIWAVIFSWICRRLAKTSTTRASLEMPTTRLSGKVGDVRLADDRHHVVFAMAFEIDVLQDHHLVITFDLFEGAFQDGDGVLGIAGEEFLVGPHHPVGRAQQALAVGVVARPTGSASGPPFRPLPGTAGGAGRPRARA